MVPNLGDLLSCGYLGIVDVEVTTVSFRRGAAPRAPHGPTAVVGMETITSSCYHSNEWQNPTATFGRRIQLTVPP